MHLHKLQTGLCGRTEEQSLNCPLFRTCCTCSRIWRKAACARALLYSPPKFCLTESMKRSEAAKYARWSAATALLLAAVTASFYLNRKWVAHREREKAPPPAPEGVVRQESGLTFSQGVGTQKLFTVEASKATNFKKNGASLLE